MSVTPRLRPAGPGDVPGLLALEQHFPSDRLSRAALRRFLRSPGARVWVAERQQAICGALILLTRAGSRRGRLYSLVVAPAARGQGLGARLVRQAEALAVQAGLRMLVLEVRADNAAARALYADLGYAVERSLPGYYDDGADGLRLSKPLGTAP
ncbi:MAG: N-acetyltransferase family protein [Gammaproteobacteria bacterium]